MSAGTLEPGGFLKNNQKENHQFWWVPQRSRSPNLLCAFFEWFEAHTTESLCTPWVLAAQTMIRGGSWAPTPSSQSRVPVFAHEEVRSASTALGPQSTVLKKKDTSGFTTNAHDPPKLAVWPSNMHSVPTTCFLPGLAGGICPFGDRTFESTSTKHVPSDGKWLADLGRFVSGLQKGVPFC